MTEHDEMIERFRNSRVEPEYYHFDFETLETLYKLASQFKGTKIVEFDALYPDGARSRVFKVYRPDGDGGYLFVGSVNVVVGCPPWCLKIVS